MPRTILEHLLVAKERQTPQNAVWIKKKSSWEQISWSEYFSTAEKVAAGLASLGIKPGDRVAIKSNSRFEWAVSDMAILGLGAITVPIYQNSLPDDTGFILNNSEASVLFCEDKHVIDKWRAIKSQNKFVKQVVCFNSTDVSDGVISWESLLQKGSERLKRTPHFFVESCEKVNRNGLATIVYTSGTTGVPKGVMLTHEQIMSEVEDVFKVIDIKETDRSLTFLPFAHILGRIEHWAHIYTGFCMAYAESIDKIRDNLGEVQPTFLISVPRIFEKIYNGIISQAETSPVRNSIFKWAMSTGKKVSESKIENRQLPFSVQLEYQLARKLVFDKLAQKLGGRMRFAVSGGAPLSADIARFFHAANLLILEGYGLTETTAAISANTPVNYMFGTVGKPLGDVQVKIAEDGEVLIKSKKVMIGYYNNESATAEVLNNEGWFATGDIGELTEEGFLKITDRKKDLIKTAGGKYVAPQKLENLLKLNKFVSNVLIHGDKKKYIVALLTPNYPEVIRFAEGRGIAFTHQTELAQNVKVKELFREAVAEANNQLASFETIKGFDLVAHDFTIEAGELTPSLKVKRKFCDQKYREQIEALYS